MLLSLLSRHHTQSSVVLSPGLMEKSSCTCTNLFVLQSMTEDCRLDIQWHQVAVTCSPKNELTVIFLNKYLTLYHKVLPLLPLCNWFLKKKGHRVRHEEQFIALYSGKAAENFIITLTNHGYSQRSHSHSREKTHNSFFFFLLLLLHFSSAITWVPIWAEKIVRALELIKSFHTPWRNVKYAFFFFSPEEPKSKLVYISGRQRVAISEFALMNYILGLMQGADSSEEIFGS